MADWSGLRTYEDWADKLAELLDAARVALASGDSNARGTAKRDLMTFIDKSPNWLIKDLDEIADAARRELSKAQIDDALTGIEDRTAELVRLRKLIGGATEGALAAASSMRLERAKAVIDSTTGVITQMRQLKDTVVEEGGNGDLVALIEKTVSSVQKLRDSLERE